MIAAMTFVKGTPKPPNSGRRKGSVNKGTIRERLLVTQSADREIVNKVLEEAKAGDIEARRLYFRYLRPPMHECFILPTEYRAPTNVEEARALVLELGERLTKGELSLQAHDALVGGLRAYLADKAAEHEHRLAELEDVIRNEGPDELRH
jgi:hypothetical protein